MNDAVNFYAELVLAAIVGFAVGYALIMSWIVWGEDFWDWLRRFWRRLRWPAGAATV